MFSAIGRFFSNLFASPAMKAFEQFLKDVFTAEVANLQSQLMSLAITEVGVLISNQSLTGPQKREQATANIVNAAKNAGIQFTTSSVNLALEMAYQKLQNSNAGITVNGKPAPVNTWN